MVLAEFYGFYFSLISLQRVVKTI